MASSSQDSLLRLMAHDDEDLQVMASVLQDSLTRPDFIVYHKKQFSLTLALNRFCWEQAHSTSAKASTDVQADSAPASPKRTWSIVRADSVSGVKVRNFPAQDSHQPIQLLTILFKPYTEQEKAPGGFLHFVFAGERELSLDVEEVNVTLMDVSETWDTLCTPEHG